MYWSAVAIFVRKAVTEGVTCLQDSVDQQPMTDMIPYWQNTGAAADGLHNRLSGMFWWAWNSNAGMALPAGVVL